MDDQLQFHQSVTVQKVSKEDLEKERMQMSDARLQNLASMLGVDWQALRDFLSHFHPLLRETVMVILEQLGWLPKTSQESVQGTMMQQQSEEQQSQIVGMYGFDRQFFVMLLQRVGPILAQILIDLLRNPMVAQSTSNG